jgi:quercetin dioxygenase-like cupin family protein
MQFVFDTSKVRRYRFPTHVNELVLDRSNAQASEVFIVVLEPGEAPPLHRHDDTEQIFYILEGRGTLTTGAERMTHDVKPGDVVRIPPSTLHSIQAVGEERLKYVAVDCFVNGRPSDEPTWEDHVKVVCRQQGWSFDEVVAKE